MPQVIAQLKEKTQVPVPEGVGGALRVGHRLSKAQQQAFNLSFDAKVLEMSGKEGADGDNKAAGQQMALIGIYRKPLEFLECAKKLKHPFDSTALLDKALIENIFHILTRGKMWLGSRGSCAWPSTAR